MLGGFSRQDAFHLSALTWLTSLSLSGCPAVDDAVAVALVSSMPKLQQLALSSCGIKSDAVLPLLRNLRQLRSLTLSDCAGLQDARWPPVLTSLTHVKWLLLARVPQLSEASRVSIKQTLGGRVRFIW